MKLSPISLIPILVVFDLMAIGLVYLILLAIGIVANFWLVASLLLAASGIGLCALFLIDLHQEGEES
jgi:hypothetical protein